MAAYFKALESDLQSIAASGWGAELIPEEQILQSQFPEVLVQIEKDQTRIVAVENLWQKYAVTTKQILAERDREAAQLDAFLKELGYE